MKPSVLGRATAPIANVDFPVEIPDRRFYSEARHEVSPELPVAAKSACRRHKNVCAALPVAGEPAHPQLSLSATRMATWEQEIKSISRPTRVIIAANDELFFGDQYPALFAILQPRIGV